MPSDPAELGDLRRFALALPQVTEEPHHSLLSWRVEGRIFATFPLDGAELRVFVDPERAAELAEAAPEQAEPLYWGATLSGLRLHLGRVERAWAEGVLGEAWARRASARLRATVTLPAPPPGRSVG